MQVSKLSLAEAIAKAEAAHVGMIYSITPAVKNGEPIFNLKVATPAGKSVDVTVSGKTGTLVQ
jgi:uncharacterized membrane protein YkoI